MHHNNSETNLCDGVGAYCFENALKKAFDSKQCKCLPGCEYVDYNIKKDVAKINFDEECNNKPTKAFDWDIGSNEKVKTSGHVSLPYFSDVSKKYDLLDLVGEKIR